MNESSFEKWMISELNDRCVFSVQGPDATSLLQNSITNDMKIFERDGASRAAIYTSLLSPKGKILYDAIIVKPRLAG